MSTAALTYCGPLRSPGGHTPPTARSISTALLSHTARFCPSALSDLMAPLKICGGSVLSRPARIQRRSHLARPAATQRLVSIVTARSRITALSAITARSGTLALVPPVARSLSRGGSRFTWPAHSPEALSLSTARSPCSALSLRMAYARGLWRSHLYGPLYLLGDPTSYGPLVVDWRLSSSTALRPASGLPALSIRTARSVKMALPSLSARSEPAALSFLTARFRSAALFHKMARSFSLALCCGTARSRLSAIPLLTARSCRRRSSPCGPRRGILGQLPLVGNRAAEDWQVGAARRPATMRSPERPGVACRMLLLRA